MFYYLSRNHSLPSLFPALFPLPYLSSTQTSFPSPRFARLHSVLDFPQYVSPSPPLRDASAAADKRLRWVGVGGWMCLCVLFFFGIFSSS